MRVNKGIKISVVTVSYNAEQTIEHTIQSVLNQSYGNVEYIIIDGGSTDGTVDIIRKYADKIAYWVSEPDNGIYDAMNKGIDIATGDYINFMNAGDSFFDNDVLLKCEPTLMLNPAVVFGSVYRIGTNGLWHEVKPIPFFRQTESLKDTGICHQSTFVRSDVIKRHGFDRKYSIAADYNLLKILYENGEEFKEIPYCIAVYDSTGISSTDYRRRIKEFAEISGLNPNSLKIRMDILLYPLKRFVIKLFGW